MMRETILNDTDYSRTLLGKNSPAPIAVGIARRPSLLEPSRERGPDRCQQCLDRTVASARALHRGFVDEVTRTGASVAFGSVGKAQPMVILVDCVLPEL